MISHVRRRLIPCSGCAGSSGKATVGKQAAGSWFGRPSLGLGFRVEGFRIKPSTQSPRSLNLNPSLGYEVRGWRLSRFRCRIASQKEKPFAVSCLVHRVYTARA